MPAAHSSSKKLQSYPLVSGGCSIDVPVDRFGVADARRISHAELGFAPALDEPPTEFDISVAHGVLQLAHRATSARDGLTSLQLALAISEAAKLNLSEGSIVAAASLLEIEMHRDSNGSLPSNSVLIAIHVSFIHLLQSVVWFRSNIEFILQDAHYEAFQRTRRADGKFSLDVPADLSDQSDTEPIEQIKASKTAVTHKKTPVKPKAKHKGKTKRS